MKPYRPYRSDWCEHLVVHKGGDYSEYSCPLHDKCFGAATDWYCGRCPDYVPTSTLVTFCRDCAHHEARWDPMMGEMDYWCKGTSAKGWEQCMGINEGACRFFKRRLTPWPSPPSPPPPLTRCPLARRPWLARLFGRESQA